MCVAELGDHQIWTEVWTPSESQTAALAASLGLQTI